MRRDMWATIYRDGMSGGDAILECVQHFSLVEWLQHSQLDRLIVDSHDRIQRHVETHRGTTEYYYDLAANKDGLYDGSPQPRQRAVRSRGSRAWVAVVR